MAVYELTEAELDAVNGGTFAIRQRNVSVQLAANVAYKSDLSTTANASASGYWSGASATAQGGQVVQQTSDQSNNIS